MMDEKPKGYDSIDWLPGADFAPTVVLMLITFGGIGLALLLMSLF